MSIPQFLSQIYIENQSQANPKIGVPLTGEPPYALIIPGDFDYPLEFESINKAYDSFGSWARNAGLYDWLNSKNDSKVVDNTQRNP
jgi:LruC domain-containing protein